MRKYLLSIEDLMGPAAEGLWERAFYRVDSERRQKAERLGAKRPRAACLGAGLLLQLALREALEADGCGQGPAAYPGDFREAGGAFCGGPEGFTVCGLLERLGGRAPLPLTFRYGGRGKPYLREYPFFFNLSHSGSFCICALSGEEVGADIQQHRPGAGMRIAKRYFAGRETAALEECKEGGDALFFRLWTRKEAYGKLTGEGIAGAAGMDLLPEAALGTGLSESCLPGGKRLLWEEYCIPGYSISFCRYS